MDSQPIQNSNFMSHNIQNNNLSNFSGTDSFGGNSYTPKSGANIPYVNHSNINHSSINVFVPNQTTVENSMIMKTSNSSSENQIKSNVSNYSMDDNFLSQSNIKIENKDISNINNISSSRNLTTSLPIGTSSTSQSTDPEKKKLIQQQLLLLLHAHKCQRQETSETNNNHKNSNSTVCCTTPHCKTMRQVLEHMSNCKLGKNCSTPHCASSRQIISHWKNCINPKCPVCEPLKQTSRPNKPPMTQGQTSDTTILDNSDWRKDVSKDQRYHLVRRIVSTIFPSRDPSAIKDPRMYNLIEYARRTENEMYNAAKDREEYFHLLAEKCFKIHKELEQKRKDRLSAKQQNGGNPIEIPAAPSRDDSPMNDYLNKQEYPTNNEMQDRFEQVLRDKYNQSSVVVKQEVVSTRQDNPNTQQIVKSEITEAPSNEINHEIKVKKEPSTMIKSNIKTWNGEELKTNFMPIWQDVFNDKNADPFREPVDYDALNIPDYPEVIKHPMDLSSIRQKLENGIYTDPWTVVDDFWLMFKNAWKYNRKTTRVYKACSKLAEIFESKINSLMSKLGFCCGKDFSYEPQVLFCNTVSVCTIAKDAIYYEYQNNGKSHLLSGEKYLICDKCFSDATSTIRLTDDPQQGFEMICKDDLIQHRNNVKVDEKFVICKRCGRKWHEVCALFHEEIWNTGFVCQFCLTKTNGRRKPNKFTAKKLPTCNLSNYLEKRVNDFLKKKEADANEVTIRILASCDKTVEVKPLMRSRFAETNEMPESFPYRLKAIYAFQEIDGVEVCFFGLYVQEYGSDCPQPNTRRVYIAYLDSVYYFQPRQYRTDVYHEILLGYLMFAKNNHFSMAHIWSCPPGEGDDYIFHMHPPDQKIPKEKRLIEWYVNMLRKALIEQIVSDYKDILKDSVENNLLSPAEIPYFDGDFWPNTLEDILKEFEEEIERRRMEENSIVADDTANSDYQVVDYDKRGKKKAKKRKEKRGASSGSGSAIPNKRKKTTNGSFDGGTELSKKVYDVMEKVKQLLFVIRLIPSQEVNSLPETKDPDPIINSDLMESRDAFLQMCREKNLEFCSLRRAKYSTMVMLYEIYNERRQSFMYACTECGDQTDTCYHCNECEEYDVCGKCKNAKPHPHELVMKGGFWLDDDNSADNNDTNNDSVQQRYELDTVKSKRAGIDNCIKALMHACQCRDSNCRINNCLRMKRIVQHTKTCAKKALGTCEICKQLIALCFYHAKICKEQKCYIPFCHSIKYRLKQKKVQQQFQQNQSVRRRCNAVLNTEGDSINNPGTMNNVNNSSIRLHMQYPNEGMTSQQPNNNSLTTPTSTSTMGQLKQSNQSLTGHPSPAALNAASQAQKHANIQRAQAQVSLQQQQTHQLMPNSMGLVDQSQTQQTIITTAANGPTIQQNTLNQRNNNFLLQSNGGNLSAPTRDEVFTVQRVIADIKKKFPQNEQNSQFSTWLSENQSFRAAFDFLRKRKSQQLQVQQQQQQQQNQGATVTLVQQTNPNQIINNQPLQQPTQSHIITSQQTAQYPQAQFHSGIPRNAVTTTATVLTNGPHQHTNQGPLRVGPSHILTATSAGQQHSNNGRLIQGGAGHNANLIVQPSQSRQVTIAVGQPLRPQYNVRICQTAPNINPTFNQIPIQQHNQNMANNPAGNNGQSTTAIVRINSGSNSSGATLQNNVSATQKLQHSHTIPFNSHLQQTISGQGALPTQKKQHPNQQSIIGHVISGGANPSNMSGQNNNGTTYISHSGPVLLPNTQSVNNTISTIPTSSSTSQNIIINHQHSHQSSNNPQQANINSNNANNNNRVIMAAVLPQNQNNSNNNR